MGGKKPTQARGGPEPRGGVGAFRRNLLEWFGAEARDYPWRRTRDPYAILVSEAMLQQTQIATVMGRGYFERWMGAFPDWETLATAPEAEVLKIWEGLGYYNRARHLQRTAAIVVAEHGGRFPEDPATVRSLPGVGRYTAGAVLSLAFGQRTAVVDGNVSRVLSRIFACSEPIDGPGGVRLAWKRAEALVPEEDPGRFNSALMELGQRICRPSAPACSDCPVRAHCLARERDEVGLYPAKRTSVVMERREEFVLLAVENGRVWLQPEQGARRRGLWRLPEVPPEAATGFAELFRFDYPITRYRVTLRVHAASPGGKPALAGEGAWFSLADPDGWPPLGAPYRKALVWFEAHPGPGGLKQRPRGRR